MCTEQVTVNVHRARKLILWGNCKFANDLLAKFYRESCNAMRSCLGTEPWVLCVFLIPLKYHFKPAYGQHLPIFLFLCLVPSHLRFLVSSFVAAHSKKRNKILNPQLHWEKGQIAVQHRTRQCRKNSSAIQDKTVQDKQQCNTGQNSNTSKRQV